MNLGLASKTVIVTGGGSNIGRGISLAFAQEHLNLVIAEIDEAQGQKVAKEASALGSEVVCIKTDVTDYNSVEAMVKETLRQFGKIDVLVNNVGGAPAKLFMDKPREEWDQEIKLNYLSAINCTRAVLEHMIERRAGRIVSLISDSARTGELFLSVYAGAKAAVIAFSKSVAKEMGRYGININCVSPGLTLPERSEDAGELSRWSGITRDSFMNEKRQAMIKHYPLRRPGTPEDLAGAVVFLASDAASFITGQVLSVSGGITMV